MTVGGVVIRLGRQCLTLALVCAFTTPVWAKGDEDSVISRLRSEVFLEQTLGNPQISLKQIDEDFVVRLFKIEGAVEAIGRIFTDRNYSNINQKIGKIRNRINLEVWADIVSDYGVPVELNNAGKMNGVISDLDQTIYSDAQTIVDREGNTLAEGADEVHQFLIEEFSRRFGNRMQIQGTSQAVGQIYDMMHFAGNGMLADWRMSDSRWIDFRIALDGTVESLSQQGGAYWFPGAYKTQVYTRYLLEGKTIRIEPSIDKGSAPIIPGYDQLSSPPGVKIQHGNTRDLSKLYADVPITVDRTGALGSLYENSYHAEHQRNLLKSAKYTNRQVDTALIHATNLEVDFRRLLLEGRDGARQHFVRKIFSQFEGNLPTELNSLEDIQRVMEVNQRIELDKIIRNSSEKPASWTESWRSYNPQNINDVETKLEYYSVEVAEITEALTPLMGEEWDPSSPEAREQLAIAAEKAFQQKSRAVTRLGAVALGRKLFRDLLSREGFARQRHLLAGNPGLQGRNVRTTMHRLVAERVADLHIAMVFIDDPALIDLVIQEAPPEIRSPLQNLRSIAQAQRNQVISRTGAIDQITAEQLAEGDSVLRELLHRLDLPAGLESELIGPNAARNVPGMARFASFSNTEWYRRTVLTRIHEAIVESYQSNQRLTSDTVSKKIGTRALNYAAETYVFNLEKAKIFYRHTLPAMFEVRPTLEMGYFGREYINSFLNVGTVDSGAKIAAAYAMGNHKAAQQEIRDAILNGIPIGGDLFSFAKNLKEWETTGKTLPVAQQIFSKGLGYMPGGAPYAAMFGHVMAYYSLAKTLYSVGWHFYGRPTQTQVVSLVLTGEYGVVPSNGGVLPQFKDSRTIEFLKQNALLDIYIDVPDLPVQWRELVLENFYLVEANRAAFDKLSSDDLKYGNFHGKNGKWHTERDRILRNQYFRNWRYWFQRLWFFETISTNFYNKMDSRFSSRDWGKIDHLPPSILEGMSQSERLASYGDAYTRLKDGTGSWDHELVLLRRFFEGWLRDWENRWFDAKMDKGEFFYNADTYVFSSDWRKAVVDELVKYYKEGEAFYLSQPEGQGLPHLNELQRRALASHSNALSKVEKRLVNEVQKEAANRSERRIKAIESLYWHPDILDRLEKSMFETVERIPPYEAIPPKIQIDIPRPVGKKGGSIPIQLTIKGDTVELPAPEEYEIKVSFQRRAEHQGRWPQEVLQDDVDILLGKNIEKEKLKVVEHVAEVKVVSRKNPRFQLQEKATVYWLDLSGAPSSEEEDLIEKNEDQDAIDEVLRHLRELAAQAEGEKDEGKQHCQKIEELLTQFRQHLKSDQQAVQDFSTQIKKWEEDKIEIQSKLKRRYASEIYKLAEELGELRTQIGDQALMTCQKTQAIRSAKNKEARNEYFQKAKIHFEESQILYTKSQNIYSKIKEFEAEFGTDIQDAWSNLQKSIEAKRSQRNELNEGLIELDRTISRSVASHEKLGGSHKRNQNREAIGNDLAQEGGKLISEATLLPEAQRKLTKKAIEELQSRIQQAREELTQCDLHARKKLPVQKKDKDTLDDTWKTTSKEWDRILSELENGDLGLGKNIEKEAKEIDASIAVSDLFNESLVGLYQDAEACWAAAQRIYSEPMEGAVPNLTSPPRTADEAKKLVTEAGFIFGVSGGDSAPSERLAYRVQSQVPEPGEMLQFGQQVTATIFGNYAAMTKVPDLLGLAAGQAKAQLDKVGLVAKIIGGDPAPNTDLQFRVQSQMPGPGSAISPGDPVTVRLYSEAMATVPNVLGMDRKEATKALESAGLAPGFGIGKKAPTKEQSNKIAGQHPSAGTKIKKGTVVNAILFQTYEMSGPGMTTVPGVVGKSPKVAAELLTAAGLTPQIRQGKEAPNSDSQGKVYFQTPDPGMKVDAGTKIVVAFYSEKSKKMPVEKDPTQFYAILQPLMVENASELMAGNPQPILSDSNNFVEKARSPNDIAGLRKDNSASLVETFLSADLRTFRYAPMEGYVLKFQFSGTALKRHKLEDFIIGSRHSSQMKMDFVTPGEDPIELEGAFLFRSIGVYENGPKAAAEAAKHGTVQDLKIVNESGLYSEETNTQGKSITLSGGPLIEGWPAEMKEAHRRFLSQFFINICATEQAFHDSGQSGSKELAILRDFRDDVLSESPIGKQAIDVYYDHLSPWIKDNMIQTPSITPIYIHSIKHFCFTLNALEKLNIWERHE